MKTVLFTLAGVLAVAAAYYAGTKSIPPAVAPVAAAAVPVVDDVNDLNLQKTCSDGADKYFKESHMQQDGSHLAGYTNHYNHRLRKCLILFATTDYSKAKTERTSATVYLLEDVFEGTTYGSCVETAPIQGERTVSVCFKDQDKRPVRIGTVDEWTRYSDGMMKG